MNEKMLTIKEAAKVMQISEPHLRLLLRRGEVKGRKIGRDWLVFSTDYTRKRKKKGGDK